MNFVYRFLCRIIVVARIHHVVRLFVAGKRTTIVLYHDPERRDFERHIRYLSAMYSIITLREFLSYLNDDDVSLPSFPLVVTFDDGHKGNYELLEILRTFGIRPTMYVCSGIVATRRKYWFKYQDLKVQFLKTLSHDVRLQHILGYSGFPIDQQWEEDERQAINESEMAEMSELVDFQSHTRFHPILTTCSEEVARDEVFQSRAELEQKTGRPVVHFAYPNGDYSEREIRLLKEAGYVSARTTDVGWNSKNTDPFRLKITGVSDNAPLWMLKAELTGIPGYFYNIYKCGLSWRTLRGYHNPERNINENPAAVR